MSLIHPVFLFLLPVSLFCHVFFLGPGDGSSSSSELLSFSPRSPPKSCSVNLPLFPSPAVYGSVGGLSSSRNITLCGGASHQGDNFKQCFSLNMDRKAWLEFPPLLEPRAFSSSNQGIAPGSLLVVGGRSGQVTLNTTEIWKPRAGKWQFGPTFPYPVEQHCSVKINSSHLLITGGLGSVEPIKRYKKKSTLSDYSFNPKGTLLLCFLI